MPPPPESADGLLGSAGNLHPIPANHARCEAASSRPEGLLLSVGADSRLILSLIDG